MRILPGSLHMVAPADGRLAVGGTAGEETCDRETLAEGHYRHRERGIGGIRGGAADQRGERPITVRGTLTAARQEDSGVAAGCG